MRQVRVALAQIDPKLGDVASNLRLHRDALTEARRQGAGLVIFPELSLTGYLLRDQVQEVALRADGPELRRIARWAGPSDVVVGCVLEEEDHRFHNAAVYLSGGRVAAVHRKLYLPSYGMFDEGRDFASGDRVRAFDARFGRGGMLVCEDAWHPMCSWLLAQQGADVLIVLSSGPTRGAKPGRGISSLAVWESLVRVTAQFQTSFVVYVNRVGYEDGLHFGGGSMAVDPFGRTIRALPALETGVTVADLDPGVLRRARSAYPLLRDERIDLAWRELSRIRSLRFDLPDPAAAEEPTIEPPRRPSRRRESK